MHIGLFSDIHGNWSAMHSVWKELEEKGLSQGMALNAGDNVGYGDSPEQCIQFLMQHPNILCVRGNYDKNVAHFPENQKDLQRKWAKARPEKYQAIWRDSRLLSSSAREWLLNLPKEQTLVLEGIRVLLTHYAPGVKEGLGTWTPDQRLAELAALTDAEVVVCGHTHTPFVRRVGGVLWVNPGTVGRCSHHCAAYAVLTVSPGTEPQAELFRGKIK
jgi:putative phosphoesterase